MTGVYVVAGLLIAMLLAGFKMYRLGKKSEHGDSVARSLKKHEEINDAHAKIDADNKASDDRARNDRAKFWLPDDPADR